MLYCVVLPRSGVVFVCYGPAMVALDAYNGTVLAKTTTYPLLAVLGSSPVVTADGLKVFLQSKTDGAARAWYACRTLPHTRPGGGVADLWRFDVSQNSIGPGLTIQQNWVCRYSTLVPDCVALNTTMDDSQMLDESQLSDHFRTLRTCLPHLQRAVAGVTVLTPCRCCMHSARARTRAWTAAAALAAAPVLRRERGGMVRCRRRQPSHARVGPRG